MQNLVKNEKVRAVWGADIAALFFYELYNIADAAVQELTELVKGIRGYAVATFDGIIRGAGKAHLLQAIGAYTFFLHCTE